MSITDTYRRTDYSEALTLSKSHIAVSDVMSMPRFYRWVLIMRKLTSLSRVHMLFGLWMM